MLNLPAWLQTLMGTSLAIGAYRVLLIVWPWLFKGGKFLFGLLTASKDPTVVVNVTQPGLAPSLQSQGGPELPEARPRQISYASFVTVEEANRKIDEAIDLAIPTDLVRTADLAERLREYALADDVVREAELSTRLRDFARAEDVARLERKVDSEAAKADVFRTDAMKSIAVLLDRFDRPRGTR